MENKYLFSENMTKDLYVKIMEKHLKEIEWMAENVWINMWYDSKHISNLVKDLFKNNCIKIDWPASIPDLNLLKIFGAL